VGLPSILPLIFDDARWDQMHRIQNKFEPEHCEEATAAANSGGAKGGIWDQAMNLCAFEMPLILAGESQQSQRWQPLPEAGLRR
jgi:hypothetical protein